MIALKKVTLYSVIIRATNGGLLSLADESLGGIISFDCLSLVYVPDGTRSRKNETVRVPLVFVSGVKPYICQRKILY
jgi:hypothetical protein